jgi:Flp pilus assembly protein TadD
MSTSNSANRPHSETAGPAISDTSEQSQLDEAMRRADELLVTSLKTDERRRKRRKIIVISSIGLLLLAGLAYAGLWAANEKQKPVLATIEQEKSERLSRDGWKAIHNPATANANFEDALKLDPHNANAWSGLGMVKLLSEDPDAAEEPFRKALEIDPENAKALDGLAATYLKQQKYDAAEKHLLEVPQTPITIRHLVTLCWLMGDFDEAKTCAEKLPDGGPFSLIKQEAFNAAKAKSTEALDNERFRIEQGTISIPQNASNSAKMAWQDLRNHNVMAAQFNFQKILSTDPHDVYALVGLGWAYIFDKEETNGPKVSSDRATTYFQQALAIDPDNEMAKEGLARIDKDQGNRDSTIKIWEQLLDKNPDNQRVLKELSDAYFADGNFAKALPLLERLVKLRPRDQRVKGLLETARHPAQ